MADSNAAPRSIRDLKDAASLASKRREMEALRQRDKVDWALNREFYAGRQWVFWNKYWPGGGRLESQPTDEGDKARYKVRLTDNQILPGVQNYVAQLVKNKPVIYATPDSGSDRDLKAAEMGEALFEWKWTDLDLRTKLQSALVHASLSQGYWHITWDALAGKPMSFMLGPDGRPLIGWADEDLDIYREELQQAGVDPQQFNKTVYVGDIAVKVLPGENVLLDPTAATFSDAQYCIVIENMDPDEVRARYPKAPVNLQPDAVSGDERVNLAGVTPTDTNDQNPRTIRRVYKLYVRPGALSPKGRIVCWIESPDMILDDTPWPENWGHTDLPLVKMPGLERPDSPLDIPLVTASRPVQKALNRAVSMAEEWRNLTMKPQVLAPRGSLQQRITSEPGAMIQYSVIGGEKPEWRAVPNMPSYVITQIELYQSKLDRLFNRAPSGRDQFPARIDSGGSIDLIQEAVADQLSLVIQGIESALVRAGKLIAVLAQKNYTEPRLLKIKGSNGSTQVRKFKNVDLEGGFGFHAEVGSGLPRTRAGKQARLEFMLDKQLIDPKSALKYLDTADMTGFMAQAQSDEDQAYRSIEKLKEGQPLNPQALAQAQQQAQQIMQALAAGQPVDLDQDGVPDDPNEIQQQIQQMLEQAAIQPQMFEDYETHVNVLRRYMTSVEYEGLDPQVQQRFSDRFGAMYDALIQLNSLRLPPPKTTLQLKATTSAPVATKILARSGVITDPNEVAEPPLDTWVTDDLTAPAVQESGNTHMDQAAAQQAMAQSQDEHAVKMAKASHELSLAGARASQAHQANQTDAQGHALDQSRAEELHAEKLAQMRKPTPAPSRG